MIEPIVIEPSMMLNIADCGIVCLKMLIGCSYADVFGACYRRPNPAHVGMSTRQMISVAKKLGVTLRFSKQVDEDGVGILDLDHADGEGHFVMYAKGTIYNPAQNEWWTDIESYLVRGEWIVAGLLWRES